MLDLVNAEGAAEIIRQNEQDTLYRRSFKVPGGWKLLTIVAPLFVHDAYSTGYINGC